MTTPPPTAPGTDRPGWLARTFPDGVPPGVAAIGTALATFGLDLRRRLAEVRGRLGTTPPDPRLFAGVAGRTPDPAVAPEPSSSSGPRPPGPR